jgi:hypothetical protein
MTIKNKHDLKLKKRELEIEVKFYEKELLASASGMLDNFAGKLKNMAFEFGYHLAAKYFFSRRRRKKAHQDY